LDIEKLAEYMLFVKQTAKGEQHELLKKYTKEVCSKTILE
jgi:hypothetical protein